MLKMAQQQYIKHLYEVEERSLNEIAEMTGFNFRTVQKYAYQDDWSVDDLPDVEPGSYPVLGDFIPVIDLWLEEDRKVPRKQRHTVWRIYNRLRDECGFTGSYSSVKLIRSSTMQVIRNIQLSVLLRLLLRRERLVS